MIDTVKEDTKFPLYITVEDQGTGLISGGDLPVNTLNISVPLDIANTLGTLNASVQICSGYLNYTASDSNYAYFVNTGKTIPIIKRKSPKIVCTELQTPSSVTDERTYYFSAKLPYTYSIDKQNSVSVQPILQ